MEIFKTRGSRKVAKIKKEQYNYISPKEKGDKKWDTKDLIYLKATLKKECL